ncbi:regulation of synaptic plasticity by receptor localization to synapse [Homalodisca vitripennis]|nr:regulation of synaptic plasticity by receptor localization to synapse [Homalodisca vitripennis]
MPRLSLLCCLDRENMYTRSFENHTSVKKTTKLRAPLSTKRLSAARLRWSAVFWSTRLTNLRLCIVCRAVVEVLLTAGLDVNVRTAAGSALHEAALCGKTEVVRCLLEHGVDLGIRDEQRNTVTDLLKQFPTHVVQDIISIISRFRAVHGDQSLPPIPVPSLGSPYENVRVPSTHSPTQWDRRVSASSAISIGSDGPRHYSGLSKSLMDSSFLSDDMSLSVSGRSRDLDQMSVSSTASSTGGPSPRDIYLPMAPHPHSPTTNNKVSPTPPKKPPRRNLSVSPTHLLPLMSVSADCNPSSNAYEYLFLARSGVRSHGDLDDMMACAKLRRGVSADQYVDMKLRRSMAESDDKYQPVAITSLYENIPVRTTNPRRKLRRLHDKNYENCDPSIILSRGDLPFRKVDAYSPAASDSPVFVSNAYITLKSSQESLLNGDIRRQNCPLSPTHYQQPPTPDHPPPSALQAERSIHERIRPLSQLSHARLNMSGSVMVADEGARGMVDLRSLLCLFDMFVFVGTHLHLCQSP